MKNMTHASKRYQSGKDKGGDQSNNHERSKSHLSKKTNDLPSSDDELGDYDGQKKEAQQRAYINRLRAKELKDIRFGNTKTKVVSFHKG